MDEVKQIFLNEASESMRRMCAVFRFPPEPQNDEIMVADFHSVVRMVKNSCSFLELHKTAELASAGETLIRSVRRGHVMLSDEVKGDLLRIAEEILESLKSTDESSAKSAKLHEASSGVPELVIPHDHASEGLTESVDLATRRIALVIDDSKAMRRVLVRILEKAGFTVVEASSGEAALQILDAGNCRLNIVLVDWTLPEMDGIQVVREIKIRPETASVPIIMVTSESSEGQVEQAFKAGVDRYITKPFTKERIIETLFELGLGS